MIGKLTGILSDKNPPQVLVDCNGVGYEVQVPMSTFYNLPELGARVSLLTHFVVGELAQAVTQQEAGRLIKVPGIGKKTAERLLLELKGKLGPDLGVTASVANDAQADILQALLALGYSDKEAAAALKALPAEVGVSEGIKLALRALAK